MDDGVGDGYCYGGGEEILQGWDYCYFEGGSSLDNGVGQLDGDGGGGGGVVGILAGLAER